MIRCGTFARPKLSGQITSRALSTDSFAPKFYQSLTQKLPPCHGIVGQAHHPRLVHEDPKLPLIIHNVLEDSLIKKKWTFEYLGQQYGDRTFVANAYFSEAAKPVKLTNLIETILTTAPPENFDPAEITPYLQGWNMRDGGRDSPLMDDLMACVPHYCQNNVLNKPHISKQLGNHYNRGRYNWAGLFLAAAGSRTRLHWDALGSSSALGMLTGYKFVVLFAPSESPNLYPQQAKGNQQFPEKFFFDPEMLSQLDIYQVDLAKFPNFKNVKPIAGVIGPGDLVIIPPGWWHDVVSLTPSITVNYNFVDERNFASFAHEFERFTKCKINKDA